MHDSPLLPNATKLQAAPMVKQKTTASSAVAFNFQLNHEFSPFVYVCQAKVETRLQERTIFIFNSAGWLAN